MIEDKLVLRDGLVLGGGAQFWGYLSGQNHSLEIITDFRIVLQHTTSDWMGEITYSSYTEGMLKTPNLEGKFKVTVYAKGTTFEETRLEVADDPTIEHNPDIMCRADNAGMIGIIADEDGKGAKYWTISNAY